MGRTLRILGQFMHNAQLHSVNMQPNTNRQLLLFTFPLGYCLNGGLPFECPFLLRTTGCTQVFDFLHTPHRGLTSGTFIDFVFVIYWLIPLRQQHQNPYTQFFNNMCCPSLFFKFLHFWSYNSQMLLCSSFLRSVIPCERAHYQMLLIVGASAMHTVDEEI